MRRRAIDWTEKKQKKIHFNKFEARKKLSLLQWRKLQQKPTLVDEWLRFC